MSGNWNFAPKPNPLPRFLRDLVVAFVAGAFGWWGMSVLAESLARVVMP